MESIPYLPGLALIWTLAILTARTAYLTYRIRYWYQSCAAALSSAGIATLGIVLTRFVFM